MSQFRRAPVGNNSILGALQATSLSDTKASLPAASILDYLPVSDLMRFACVSRRMQEMVYDDTRWVARLKSMGCWDEAEARRRWDEAVARRQAAGERERRAPQDSNAVLEVLSKVKSVRGRARQEYARIYGALGPFYYDLVRARSHNDPVLFRVFRDPERQARMLSNLLTFSRSDWAEGAREREEKVTGMMGIFETAVLREFEQGYELWDVDGRMKRYAHVLDALNGGNAAVELFIAKHPLFTDRDVLADSAECLTKVDGVEGISLEPSRQFFELLAGKLNEQGALMAKIFPKPSTVFWTFVDKIKDDVIMEYCTPLFDESHERSLASYLQAVSGVFEQAYLFYSSLQVPNGTKEESEEKAKEMALRTFEPHLDLYLQEELDFFIKNSENEVQAFETRLSELDASAESFYMSNFNRQADKKDFLSSFKKVVMMPVTVLPSLPGQLLTAPFGGGSKSSAATPSSNGDTLQPTSSSQPHRPQSPGMAGAFERRGSPLPEQGEAPTDELAAKAALMASRLEGIKSLFSIEVALSLVHAAKTSLGRAAVFIRLGGQVGGEAREQCEAIFVNLLRILGQRHIKPGFDKAVGHLAHYNPRDVTDHEKGGVAPLVMFIELVNLGDLISQMIDVFYEQQLAAPKIADRNDFLDASGLAKKKFEQMLDESVAAGLNKGIDVLMDEVEYICATTQQPTDYNPTPGGAAAGGEKNSGGSGNTAGDLDIGPTETAKRVVELVSSHTRMLVGTTEKSMLDVFNGEVGLRLFQAVCKHLKRQRVSTDGAIKVISDMNLYFEYVRSLKNADLLPYFKALRELSQIYLIDPRHSKEMATIIADGDRFGGVFRAEEVYKFAERRADWYQVKRDVEKAMYGLECSLM
uniref:F-box protein pof6 n=1 Tax=Pyricularia oryzae (strain P131) TaxID=1143193 RepID=L7J0X7_PYRO1